MVKHMNTKQVQILVLSLKSCTTLGKLLNVSVLYLSFFLGIMKKKDKNATTLLI